MIALSPGMLVSPRSWWIAKIVARWMAAWERALNPDRSLKEARESKLFDLIDKLLP